MHRTTRSLVIALATSVALLNSGCASRGSNIVAMGLGLAVAGTGTAIYASDTTSSSEHDESPIDMGATIGQGFIVLGLFLVAAGGIGLLRLSRAPTKAPAPAR